MKTYSPAKPPRHVRVPAFVPVPLRSRSDGWTAARQAAFLAALAQTGSVAVAARRVSMARETAYRLRRRVGAESFAAAWDVVTGRAAPSRKVTGGDLAQRALHGLLKPHFYRGEHVATLQKADNSALLRFLAQLDRIASEEGPAAERSQGFATRTASTDRERR